MPELPPIMYRFLSEERVQEILREHDPDTQANELLEERYGPLKNLVFEQIKRRPRR